MLHPLVLLHCSVPAYQTTLETLLPLLAPEAVEPSRKQSDRRRTNRRASTGHETEPTAPRRHNHAPSPLSPSAAPARPPARAPATRKTVVAHRDDAPTFCTRARFHLRHEHRRTAERNRAAEWQRAATNSMHQSPDARQRTVIRSSAL